MKTLLVSGFLPWGKHPVNSSLNLIRLAEEMALPNDWTITQLVLPVEWNVAADKLLVEAGNADAVIAFGLAADRNSVTPESRAANASRQGTPDANRQFSSSPKVELNGPDSLATRLPVPHILRALQDRAIPADISNEAGGFICNEVFYRLLSSPAIAATTPAGFIHLPPWDLWPREQWGGVLQSIVDATINHTPTTARS